MDLVAAGSCGAVTGLVTRRRCADRTPMSRIRRDADRDGSSRSAARPAGRTDMPAWRPASGFVRGLVILPARPARAVLAEDGPIGAIVPDRPERFPSRPPPGHPFQAARGS